MNELTKASIELLINDQVALSIESDVEIGKQQLQSFDPEAHYYSDPQFRLFKTDAGWNIEHDETAINETIVNGVKLTDPVLITDGMVISVGNAAKSIQKLPIIFKLPICSENTNNSVDVLQNNEPEDYQHEFEVLHQNFSDALDNGIITFEEYDNAGAIMCALYPNETRLINIEEGNLDEDADIDDIGGIVMRDMIFDAVEDKATFLKDYQKAINHCKNDNIEEVVAEIIEERDCDFETAGVAVKATSDENIDIHINGRMKVKTLKSQFAKEFGLTMRLYDGRSFADDEATLASIRKGDHKGGDLSPDRSTKVGSLEEKILELFGLKAQIAGSDDSYLCDNELTLAEAKETDKLKMKRKINKQNKNIC